MMQTGGPVKFPEPNPPRANILGENEPPSGFANSDQERPRGSVISFSQGER